MPGISSIDQLINALSVNLKGQELHFDKLFPASTINGRPQSLWQATGFPAAGGNTTSGKANGAVCTSATTGAMPYTNPTGPATMHLASGGAWLPSAGNASSFTLILCDRIAHVQLAHNEATGSITGLDATSRLNATTGAGDGCQIWCGVTSAFSAASNVLTFTYTNQNGTGSRSCAVTTTASTAATYSVNSLLWQNLQSGDTGVRAIQSVTLTSGTATGNFNLVLVKPLMRLIITNGSALMERDVVMEVPRLPRIWDSSCLYWITIPGVATTAPRLQGSVMIVEN